MVTILSHSTVIHWEPSDRDGVVPSPRFAVICSQTLSLFMTSLADQLIKLSVYQGDVGGGQGTLSMLAVACFYDRTKRKSRGPSATITDSDHKENVVTFLDKRYHGGVSVRKQVLPLPNKVTQLCCWKLRSQPFQIFYFLKRSTSRHIDLSSWRHIACPPPAQ